MAPHLSQAGLLALLFAVAGVARARDLLVSSRFSDNVLRYSTTGEPLGVFASGHGMDNPNGIAYGPDGHLYVGLGDTGRIMVFDGQSGTFLRDLVTPATSGGLLACRAIAFLPGGDLLVNDGAGDRVMRYDATTGAFLGAFASGNGLDGPVGLTIGPDGNVYVGAALSNAVFVYDQAGNLLRTLPAPAGQSNTTGVLFHTDGSLLVAQSVSNTVQRLDPITGLGGTLASGGGLSIPIAMAFHPDGSLLVGSFGNDKVVRYNAMTGQPLGDFILQGAGGLDGTHNFAFVPVPAPGVLALAFGAVLVQRRRRGPGGRSGDYACPPCTSPSPG